MVSIHLHMYVCILLHCTTIDAPVITPSLAVLFPGSEVIFRCINATALVVWSINGNAAFSLPSGVSIVNSTALRVSLSANATTYGCADVFGLGNAIQSNNAILVMAG